MNSNKQIERDRIIGDYNKLRFSERSVYYLKEILWKGEHPSIIISSTWRYDMQRVVDAFEFNNIDPLWILGKTPFIDKAERGEEIEKFIEDNTDFFGKDIRYLILDDDTDFLDSQQDNFIHIDREEGITKKDAQKALEILNGERVMEHREIEVEDPDLSYEIGGLHDE